LDVAKREAFDRPPQWNLAEDFSCPMADNILPFIPPNTVPEGEVTLNRLSGVLEAAFLDHEVDDDGDLYVVEGAEFPFWIDIDLSRKLIRFSTFTEIDEEDRKADWLSRVNRMNQRLIVVRFCLDRYVIGADFSMSFAGGLSIRQFLKMARMFSSGFLEGLRLSQERQTASLPS
jgi:hypothetical protein